MDAYEKTASQKSHFKAVFSKFTISTDGLENR